MSSPKIPARESVPYGQACAGCSKAKCRCIGRAPGQACERCNRLGKECRSSTLVRKRVARRPATKVARLEEKLDDLVTLLKTQATAGVSVQRQGVDDHNDQQSIALETRLPLHSLENPIRNQPEVARIAASANVESGVSSAYTTPSSNSTDASHYSEPSAEEYLSIFQNHHLKSLPFIYIPPDTTAAQLQRERPFLWLNIQTMCCKSITERKKRDKKIREILAQHLIVDSEPSLDLLLGLVAYIAWTMDNARGKKMLGCYSNLASSLACDLGLHLQGTENPCKETESFKAFSRPIKRIDPAIWRTNEERRCILACFAMCSTVASFIKSQPMRWTTHMENCLKHLDNNPEWPGDEVLVAIVKISKIMDDVTNADYRRVFETESYGLPKTPPTLYVKALLANLEAIEKTLKPEVAQNKVIKSYLSDTYMMINHMPLPTTGHATKLPASFELGRIECFYASVRAAQQCLDCWFAFTPEELFGSSMTLLLHFGRCTHLLYRLSMAEDPAWAGTFIRNTVDLVQALERGVERVTSVIRVVQLQTDGTDIFSLSAATMRAAIPVWGKAFANANAGPNTSPEGTEGSMEPGMGNSSAGEFSSMDLLSDPWFTDIFSNWETYQV